MSSDKALPTHGGPSAEEPFLPLSRPLITEQDVESVAAVLRSGWITTGEKCAALERAFAAEVGARHAVAVSSGTAAMHLLLHALGIGPGDEVITPSMTWVSTVNLVTLSGATPVFVDVDADTLMTDATRVEEAVSERTRLIVPVHFAGAPLDLDPLREVARSYDLPLVEDAAHAAGAGYRDRPIGAVGTSIFSLHPIKNLTSGEGGVLCTDDQALAERIRRLRFHGLGADAYQRESQGRSPHAQVLEPGFKYNLPDMNAALALSQLPRLGDMNRKRAEIARRYSELLRDLDEIRPLRVPDYPLRHAWHLYVVRLDAGHGGPTRDELIGGLKARGIGAGIHFRAVHLHEYYKHHRLTGGSLANTEWNSERLLSLPLFPGMRIEEVDRVVRAIKSILSGRRTGRRI
jgi:UDP-4-amino-4-deoxy-L-arabinose-oxoglutarate aminotransferase